MIGDSRCHVSRCSIEIGTILDKLKSSSERTSHDMSTSTDKRAEVLESMNIIKKLINSTSNSITSLSQMNVQVALSVSEQSAVAEARSVSGVAGLAEKIGQGSTESRKKFEQLEEVCVRLNQVSDKFKV